jgi:hypothetical protein
MVPSLDPKLVFIGVSPGNSPMRGDEGTGEGRSGMSAEDIGSSESFDYPDSAGYWKKVKHFARQFFASEGSLTGDKDMLDLCGHFNLGTGFASKATVAAVEEDVVKWVSWLINRYFRPDLVVLFGLNGILGNRGVARWWNHGDGLFVNWREPQHKTPFLAYPYRFREWAAQNTTGNEVRIVTWPNHPSRHPFADWQVWCRSVNEYLDRPE